MRVIVWQQEHAVLLPFESFLWPILTGPDSCQTPTFNHVDDFVQAEFKWRHGLAGRAFGHSSRSDAFLSQQLDKRRFALTRSPPLQFQTAQVLDVITTVNGNTL